MINRPTYLTRHMEDTILEMTADRLPLRTIIETLRKYYPTLREREIRFAITWTQGER